MNIRSCKHASALASEAMDRELSPGEWLSLKIHLCLCLACRRFTKHLAFLRRAAHEAGEGLPGKAELSGETRERIKQQLGVRSDE